MSAAAAKMFLNSVIFTHLNSCCSDWSQASGDELKTLQLLCRQVMETLDKE